MTFNAMKLCAASALALAIALPSMAMAQTTTADETVYMRRPLPLNPVSTTSGYEWQTTSKVTDSNGNIIDEDNYCGAVTRTNTSICVNSATKAQAATSLCGTATKPAPTEQDYIGSACSFSWVTGAWNEGASSCTQNEFQSRTVNCKNQNGEIVADDFCHKAEVGIKPSTAQSVPDYSGCGDTGSSTNSLPTVLWGAWTYDQSCSSTATKTRTGTCQVEGKSAPANVCTDNGIPLTESIPEANYAGCSYTWESGTWSDWSTTCGSATRTRTVSCKTSNNEPAVDSKCNASTKPVASETSNVSSSCPPIACNAGSYRLLNAESKYFTDEYGNPNWESSYQQLTEYGGVFPRPVEAHSKTNPDQEVYGVNQVNKTRLSCSETSPPEITSCTPQATVRIVIPGKAASSHIGFADVATSFGSGTDMYNVTCSGTAKFRYGGLNYELSENKTGSNYSCGGSKSITVNGATFTMRYSSFAMPGSTTTEVMGEVELEQTGGSQCASDTLACSASLQTYENKFTSCTGSVDTYTEDCGAGSQRIKTMVTSSCNTPAPNNCQSCG